LSKAGRNKQQLARIAQQQIQQVQFAHYSGPLPHPQALEHYNQIVPGAAERIIAQFENQAIHRQGLERKVVHSNTWCQKAGIICGFTLGLGGIGGGIYLIHAGQSAPGLATFFTTVSSLVAAFVYGKHSQKKELDEKR
jgi:uncharacterized membrane protein